MPFASKLCLCPAAARDVARRTLQVLSGGPASWALASAARAAAGGLTARFPAAAAGAAAAVAGCMSATVTQEVLVYTVACDVSEAGARIVGVSSAVAGGACVTTIAVNASAACGTPAA